MRLMVTSCLVLLFVLVANCGNANAAVLVSTTFNTDRQDWSPSFPAATGTGDFWQSSGGNPGGAVRSFDRDGSSTLFSWVFDNSTTFNGNRSAAYNGSLTFDLRDNGSGNVKTNASFPNSQFDVLISTGSAFLAYTTLTPPTGDVWTSYSLTLNETSGWRYNTNFATAPPTWAAPTQSQFQAVLASISDIQIRGDYWLADETTWLDNVSLNSPAAAAAVPEPASLAIWSLGALGCAIAGYRRKRQAA